MGCTESKTKKQPSRQPSSVRRRNVKRCHHCGNTFPLEDFNQHSVTCDKREVACHHSWCRKILKQGELKAHMRECAQQRKSHCSKCGDSFPIAEMNAHRDRCGVVQCSHCPEKVIPRLLKYCPNAVFGQVNYRVGPFASDHLRRKHLLLERVTSPNRASPHDFHDIPLVASTPNDGSLAYGGSPTSPKVRDTVQNYNVARVQHLWRWAKAKAVMDDLLYRIVYREIDTKKETFSIFKAHDDTFSDAQAERRVKRQKSAAPVQAVAPVKGHYIPVDPTERISIDHVHRVIDDFAHRKPLPYHAVWRILSEGQKHLMALPNIQRITPPDGARVVKGRWVQGGKIVVVGDLHGQLQDLLHILNENAMPSERCLYVFNGDFVDRGQYGLEVLTLLLMLQIVFPKSVALNRGNHECDYMNEEYGFDIEVQTKYDRNIFKLTQSCFCSLPLATLIGTRVFVVHGGLPRAGDVTFDEIDSMQRFRQIPMPELQQPEEDEIFQDLMWSDPMPQSGWAESDRGVGVKFGPDVTNAFLTTNGLELVIRSHEECISGYEEHHGGKLLTVFSASNYDGADSNNGATVTLTGDSSECTFHTYHVMEDDFIGDVDGAPPTPAHTNQSISGGMTRFGTGFNTSFAFGKEPSTATFRHYCASLLGSINFLAMKKSSASLLQHGHMERRSKDVVLRTVRERIYERRHRLLGYFTKIDRTCKGSLWKMEWVETMQNVLNLDLPWFFLRPNFTDVEPKSYRINYARFLARFRDGMSDLWREHWYTAQLAQLHLQLFGGRRKKHPVVKVLEESEEVISYNEFCSAIRQADPTATDDTLFELFLHIDRHHEGFVAPSKLLEALDDAATRASEQPQFDDESEEYVNWDLSSMDQLSQIIGRIGNSQLHNVFGLRVQDSVISSYELFEAGMMKLCKGVKRPISLSPQQLKQMWHYLTSHCAEPEFGLTVDEVFLAFSVRDRVTLLNRRDAFNDIASRMLANVAPPLRRKMSLSYCGFGPTPPAETSPERSTPVDKQALSFRNSKPTSAAHSKTSSAAQSDHDDSFAASAPSSKPCSPVTRGPQAHPTA